jgi:cytochrome c-type biogenesis protein CcmE
MPRLSPKKRRLYAVLNILLGAAVATTLVLFALRNNVAYFRTPSDIVTRTYPEHGTDRAFRLGGLVEKNSLHRDGTIIIFTVTDLKQNLEVHYNGLPPDLFREGQGVVAEGKMDADGHFIATTLLAKHDEKYMPPEVARELKKNGMAP